MSDRKMSRRAFAGAVTAGVSLWQRATAAEQRTGTDKIRIGQIGVGHAHASKLAVYRHSPDYEVVGLAEPDPVLRKEAESQAVYRDLPWMTPEQLLNLPGLQAVLVETRVRDSLNVATDCVAAGKHIHLDKPAGESLPKFQQLMAAAERQGLLVQMGYMYRYNPAVLLLHEFLDRGWLGQVFEIHAVMSKVIPPANRRALAEYPGGVMFELGCHLLDLVVGVLGEPEQVISLSQQVSPQGDSFQDNMLAVLRYPQSIASVKSSGLEVAGFSRRHLVVCGTKGTFHIQPLDDPAARLALTEPRGRYQAGVQEIAFPKYTRYVADAADMASILRGEKEPDFSYDHDVAVQRTLLQACRLPLNV